MNKYLAGQIIEFAETNGVSGLNYADVIAKHPARKAGIDAELTLRGHEDLIEK